jgi:hypothetical protein
MYWLENIKIWMLRLWQQRCGRPQEKKIQGCAPDSSQETASFSSGINRSTRTGSNGLDEESEGGAAGRREVCQQFYFYVTTGSFNRKIQCQDDSQVVEGNY